MKFEELKKDMQILLSDYDKEELISGVIESCEDINEIEIRKSSHNIFPSVSFFCFDPENSDYYGHYYFILAINLTEKYKVIEKEGVVQIAFPFENIECSYELSRALKDKIGKEVWRGVDFKLQKVCHDESTPPYDSYCSFCSRSSGCSSKHYRASLINEMNTNINAIEQDQKWRKIEQELSDKFSNTTKDNKDFAMKIFEFIKQKIKPI